MPDDRGHLDPLLGALDLAFFERRPTGALVAVGAPPDWFRAAWGAAGASALPVERSEFLAHFLSEADEFWREGGEGRLASGPWSEASLEGGETQFEAHALTGGGRAYLAIERLGPRHVQRRTALQAVRERNLFLEQLMAVTEDRFVLLDCIVHDLGGPLQGIKSCLSAIGALPPGDDRLADLVQVGLRQVDRQSGLIDDILKYFASDVIAPALVGAMPPVDLAACASEVVELMAPAAATMGRTLALDPDVDPSIEFPVRARLVELERVMANLVQNALRHAPLGTAVVVGVARDGDWQRATVDDRGPGVPAELQASLFERRAAGRRNPGRAGLGLYFTRRAVESWGGRVGFEPRAGGGTRFWFALPAAAPADQV